MSSSVLALLKARQRGGSDGRKIALVLEGGGMRGIYLAGMLRALEMQGIRASHFDFIVGSSVGAYLACYYVAEKSDLAQEILLSDAFDDRFINLSRLFGGGLALDNGWMVDDVFFGRKPFGPLEHSENLFAVCTQVPDGKPVIFSLDTTEKRQRAILKATGAIPLVAGPAIEIDNKLYVDGGISEQIPISEAEKLGATDILVLLTRKHSDKRKSWLNLNHLVEETSLRKMYGGNVAQLYRLRRSGINRSFDDIDRKKTDNGTNLEGIFVPQQSPNIKRLTKNFDMLNEASKSCYDDVLDRFRGI